MSRTMRAVICSAGIVTVLVGAVAFAQNRNGRKITGVVESAETLRPVANAHVQYDERGQPTQSTVTDSAGWFEIPTGTRGVVTISAQGFGTARRSWPARTGGELRFSLVPPSTVRGTIDDVVTGRPIDSIVTVHVSQLTNHVSDTALAEDGTFRFDDLPPGPAVLVAHAEGYAPSFSELTVDHKMVRDVRIRLLLEAGATGHVLDDDPVVGARVRVRYADTLASRGLLNGLVRGNVVVGPNGAFVIAGLVPDTPITVWAELDGRQSNDVTITVGPGMVFPDIALQLQP